MCGIFGYIGSKDATPICIQGLKKLEYRGYDSSGIAGIKDHKIILRKEVGKIAQLESSVTGIHLDLAIAHTRWATHGKPSRQNAHPQVDQQETLALVHNGVIENYALLRDHLTNVHFTSETDTEVIAQLLATHYQGDLLKAVVETTSMLEGAFALAIIHKDHPDTIIAVGKKSPLIVGFSEDSFIASDLGALAEYDLDTYFLIDGEITLLQREKKPLFFNAQGCPITKTASHQAFQDLTSSKQQFEHFMLKEIFEQQDTIRYAFEGRFDGFEELSHIDLKSIERVVLVGCGSSWHSAFITAYLLESIAHLSATAEIASEYRYKDPVITPNTLMIALSQSGETADTLAVVQALKAKGVRVLSLCNVPGSSIAREADATIFLKSGQEVAVASTKTLTSQLSALYLLVLSFARERGHLSTDQNRLFCKRLYEIPDQITQILQRSAEIALLAKKYAHFEDFFFLGRDVLFPTALEAALKLKEIAYINASGYPAGEMKHGPIALLSPQMPVIIFAANKRLHPKIMSNLMESKARGAPILVFGWRAFEHDLQGVADDVFWIPETSDELAPIIVTVATQLFAYYVAVERKTHIDQPRNLAKSVTVE